MYIEFRNKKIEKICNNFEIAKKKYNVTVAKKIVQRLNEFRASKNFKIFCSLKIRRCHKLSGDYDEKFAVYLDGKTRLIFSIISDKDLHDINFEEVLGVIIEEVTDYHG
ncbi:MAG: type II toxin-antitoxin system RelE/ParE family toxin [Caldisericia bacterium]|nr:type II toxin-antitoxin system RelE/ParE family toxin [Caldisericia bacterium]